MAGYVFTQAARQDLWDLRDRVLADQGPAVARRILTRLDAKLRRLAEFPGMGRPRPDLTAERVSFLPFYRWLIVYLPKTSPLQVVRIVGGWRDLRQLLG